MNESNMCMVHEDDGYYESELIFSYAKNKKADGFVANIIKPITAKPKIEAGDTVEFLYNKKWLTVYPHVGQQVGRQSVVAKILPEGTDSNFKDFKLVDPPTGSGNCWWPVHMCRIIKKHGT